MHEYMLTDEEYKNIKNGDILYESGYGITFEIKVVSEPEWQDIPKEDRTAEYQNWQLKFVGETVNGKVDFLITPLGLAYNCGRLSKVPEYTGDILKIDGTIEKFSLTSE